MTARTWKQSATLMAAIDAELSLAAVIAAVGAARRRWHELEHAAGVLLVDRADLQTARALIGAAPIADVREVDELPDGWAVAWPGDAP